MSLNSSTWIALVGPEIEENLGLRYLASSLTTAGISSRILKFNEVRDFESVLQGILDADTPPAMVALSLAFQWRAPDFLSVAVALRERGYEGHITTGGHFATFAASELLGDFPELDSVCIYEAERGLAALAQAVLACSDPSGIEGVAIRGSNGCIESPLPPVTGDLSTTPWPERRDDPTDCLGHPIAPIVGSRGCYARCAFCCIAAWHRLPANPKPHRRRPVEDVASEMVWLNQHLGRDIFMFHDDNFFLPNKERTLERINSLADHLDARGMGTFASVVKARPGDVTPPLIDALKQRMGMIRIYLGIENNSRQGLSTLGRGTRQAQNQASLDLMRSRDISTCFNILMFDPDTSLKSIEENLSFMASNSESPHAFSRVELYTGTPLLARMQNEGRCRGNYLGFDYRLASREVQDVFEISTSCFFERNFGADALVDRLQALRFETEVFRYFHPEISDPAWIAEAKSLSRRLMTNTVEVMREICDFAKQPRSDGEKQRFVRTRSQYLRDCEAAVRSGTADLEARIRAVAPGSTTEVKADSRGLQEQGPGIEK
jgi:radical SAM superfamily enzyme YgiQ (UPF0313 family)